MALCGLDRATVSSVLIHTRIIPWSPTISALLIGEDVCDRWKVLAAKKQGIPVIPFSTLKSKAALLWADKYAPKKAKEIIGNTESINSLYEWLNEWTVEKDRAVLITGPPGIGKTTAAHLVAKLCKLDIIELNASTERSAKAIKDVFKEASDASHIGKKRVVIMDEVDGMSSGDRGGIGALAGMIKTCSFPIICIANERGTPRLRPLTSACKEIKFFRPVRSIVAKSLMKTIVMAEGLKISLGDLEELCERNGNDIRQILNFLQFHLSSSSKGKTKDELLRIDVFSATGRLFGFEGNPITRSENCWVDYSMVPLMVAEGYAGAVAKSRGSDEERLQRLVAASDLISEYDMIDQRIHRKNEWSLLPAAMTIVSYAAAATKGPAPFQLFPSVLGKMSKRAKHVRLYKELARRVGSSAVDMCDAVNTYRTCLFGLKDAEAVCDTLVGYGLSRDIMMDTLTETVFTGDESSVAMDSKLKSAVTRAWKKRGIVESEKATGDDEDLVDDYDSEDEEVTMEDT